ncbi:MAG: FeoB-associated Cys-rich membrane protein [Cyclobacteriaceae bacterium]|nr:FeoB-associated Cys-rich membrane protein [Cyclobacteriaceae bacterium]
MQEILVLLVVAAAAAYLGFRLYKSLFSKKSNCEVNCGCEASSPVLEQFKKKR